jgi:peptide/nickel transport system substrate-binding protein
MREKRLRLALFGFLVLLIAIAAGCGGDGETAGTGTTGGDTTQGTTGGGRLVVNIAQAPATLDPAWGCGLYDIGFLQNFYVRLTQYGSKPGPEGTTEFDPSKIEPYFAESIDVSPDGLIYTFKLPEGVTFPSGEPVDARAVKYSLERSIKMAGCGGYFIYDGIYEPPLVKAIQTPDPTTVVITLSVPNANFLQDLAQPAASIVDRSVVEANGGIKAGEINEYMSSHVAGSGPFLLDEYEPNKRAVLSANPDFFGEPPASDEIIVNFINADPTLLLQARSGQADVTLGMTKQSANSIREDPCCTVIANEDPTFWEIIGTPWKKKPWDNAKFREAVTHAVPYEEIIEKVAYGWAEPFYGPYAPGMNEYNAELSAPREFDIEKAKALVAESGVQTPVSVTINIPEGNTIEEQIATIVQGTWRELGIDVKINKLAATDYINSMEQHEAQTFTRIDGPGVIEAGYLLGYDMKCGISFNLSDICMSEADKILDQARKETDPEQRQELFDEIARLWVENSPRVQVYADQFVSVLSKDVKSYHYQHEMDFRTWGK